MEKNMRASLLLDFYGAMLTDKKREIMTLYVERDTSLSEIASVLKTTRQSVYDAVKVSISALEKYEEKLKCVERYLNNREIILKCLDDLSNINTDDENSKKVQKIEKMLKKVLENQ